VASSSEMSATIYQLIWHHISDGSESSILLWMQVLFIFSYYICSTTGSITLAERAHVLSTDQNSELHLLLVFWVLRFLWRRGWGFSSCGICRCVTGWLVPNVLKEHSAFRFKDLVWSISFASIWFQAKLLLYFPYACCMHTQKKSFYSLKNLILLNPYVVLVIIYTQQHMYITKL
jgi:hypothetical protein